MAFVEAMAMELPVVALDVGGTAEIVQHGRTGLISAAGDANGLANNIRILAENPGLRRAFGVAGRAVVEQRFTADRMAREMEDVYRSMVAPAGESTGRVRRRHAE
jgi:glycosyltransferase involved in cell wall biosynthesis